MLIPKAVDQCLSLLFLSIQSQATIPQCIYSIALSLCLNPSLSLWLYHHFVIKLCTLEGNFHGLSFLWLMYRAAKKTSIALFSGLPFFCSNNQSICYFPSWGLQAHLWKGYQSSATASAPLPSKHTVMLIFSFVHPTPFACTPASCFISHQVSPPCCHWHQLCCLLFSFLWCFNVLTNTGLYTHTLSTPVHQVYLSTSHPHSAPLCREVPQNQPISSGWGSHQPDKAICSIFITIAFKAYNYFILLCPFSLLLGYTTCSLRGGKDIASSKHSVAPTGMQTLKDSVFRHGKHPEC